MHISKIIICAIIVTTLLTFSSCRLWEKIFPPKYGCKTNGKNVGAEALISGKKEDKQAVRAAKKVAKKDKRNKALGN